MGLFDKIFNKKKSNFGIPDGIRQDKVSNLSGSDLIMNDNKTSAIGESDKEVLIEFLAKSDDSVFQPETINLDSLFKEAARLVVMHQQGATSLIEKKLKLGYNRAGRLMDQLEAAGIIGPFEGSKAREVLIKDEFSLEQLLKGLSIDLLFKSREEKETFYDKYKDEIDSRKEKYKREKLEELDRIEKAAVKQRILENDRKKGWKEKHTRN